MLDVVPYVEAHGYRAYGVCILTRLHSSDTMIQPDLLFLKTNSHLVAQPIGQL